LNTYVSEAITVRAIVPKWVPKKWQKETVYETIDAYNPTLHTTQEIVVSHTVTVAVLPTADNSVINTTPVSAPHPILLSSINDKMVVTANPDDHFLA